MRLCPRPCPSCSRDTARQLITYLARQGDRAAPDAGQARGLGDGNGAAAGVPPREGTLPWPLAVATVRWLVAYVRSLKSQVGWAFQQEAPICCLPSTPPRGSAPATHRFCPSPHPSSWLRTATWRQSWGRC